MLTQYKIAKLRGWRQSAEVSFTQQTGYPFGFSVDIAGIEATIEYQYLSGASTLISRSGEVFSENTDNTCEMRVWRKGTGLEIYPVRQYDAYQKQMMYFIHCVNEGRQPEIVTPNQSYEVICMMDAIKQSADSGEKVTVCT